MPSKTWTWTSPTADQRRLQLAQEKEGNYLDLISHCWIDTSLVDGTCELDFPVISNLISSQHHTYYLLPTWVIHQQLCHAFMHGFVPFGVMLLMLLGDAGCLAGLYCTVQPCIDCIALFDVPLPFLDPQLTGDILSVSDAASPVVLEDLLYSTCNVRPAPLGRPPLAELKYLLGR